MNGRTITRLIPPRLSNAGHRLGSIRKPASAVIGRSAWSLALQHRRGGRRSNRCSHSRHACSHYWHLHIALEISQEDVLLYRRAASAAQEVLILLGQVSERQAGSHLYQQTVELAIGLDRVLGALLDGRVEPESRPVTSGADCLTSGERTVLPGFRMASIGLFHKLPSNHLSMARTHCACGRLAQLA